MAEYAVSHNGTQYTIDGVPLRQVDTSGGIPWYSTPNLPFHFRMERDAQGGEFIMGNAPPGQTTFNIDAAALRQFQRDAMLIDHSNANPNVFYHLTEGATRTLDSGDLSISPSGRSIVVGGAYFRRISFDSPGVDPSLLDLSLSAENFQPGAEGTARIQALFASRIEVFREPTGCAVVPDVSPPRIRELH